MYWTYRSVYLVCFCALARTQVIPGKSRTNDGDYNTVNTDGSFDFGYSNKDRGSSYHLAHGNANGVVGGRFGGTDPATDTIKETIYTAGPRGFRAKGPNIHRKLDLDQRPRGPIGTKDDPYADPNEDPSYAFNFDTRTYSKNENADSRGDVKGHYSFVDDVGERHDVSYIAGRDTGFHVSSAHPDNPGVIGSPFHRAPLVRGETKSRGRTAVQRGLDGSYRFISAGPDQRRTESSDSQGNVRGSYTFLDDKGVQRTVNYIAGPGIGYRIIKNNKDVIPPYFPTIPSAYDPTFTNAASGSYGSSGPAPGDTSNDDVFKGPEGTAASGHVKPPPFQVSDSERPDSPPGPITSSETGDVSNLANEAAYNPPPFSPPGEDLGYVDEDASFGGKPTKGPGKPTRPTKPYRPQKQPYVPLKPFQTTQFTDDASYETHTDTDGNPDFAVGFNIQRNKPGATIIRNIGKDYFGIPPGISVRAHVQSIDLYPFGSKPLSPSEALEKDKT
ncbi:uncharacterized protein LOC115452726 isoform X1 [Manduca sexta]|uniref:uncharacterized protein LOC115452726 isoform X1 n=1 Tax=Manduca sexta TaxID=7130 RepID=UPI00189017D0|nr:uncharacterized protein LOC115452726 isoform X1 [Manduca sexta]XP_037299517.1 uncharacterized protein LOC115452726 isoform X1 [Manduca sexta]